MPIENYLKSFLLSKQIWKLRLFSCLQVSLLNNHDNMWCTIIFLNFDIGKFNVKTQRSPVMDELSILQHLV